MARIRQQVALQPQPVAPAVVRRARRTGRPKGRTGLPTAALSPPPAARPALAPAPPSAPRSRCWQAPPRPATPRAAPGRRRAGHQHRHPVSQVGLVHARQHGLAVPRRPGQPFPRKRPVTAVASSNGFFSKRLSHCSRMSCRSVSKGSRLASSTVFGVWPSIIAPTASDSFLATVLRSPGSAPRSPRSTSSASFFTVPHSVSQAKIISGR